MASVRVLGLGNVLMGDDAFGPYVARWIEARWTLPAEVEIADIGTPGLDLIPHVSGAEALVFVDTVRADARPGSLRLYRKDALLRTPAQPRLSPHDPGVKEALLALELEGTGPLDVLLVGVVPEKVETGPGLSPAVRATVPYAEQAVLRELKRLGFEGARRIPAAIPDIWWERLPGTRGERCTS